MRAKRLLFSAFTVVAFFAVVELVLWFAGVPTLLDQRDPFWGFSASVRVFELDAERGVYRMERRAVTHSFNYQEFAAAKPANDYRVFVLGGSSAYGFPWGADVAFPRLLQTALRASYPEREIEVINVAAMSYGSHRLRILVRELFEHAPDLLVIYSGHNEFVERRFYRDLLERDETLDPLRSILYRWRLYSWLVGLRDATRTAGPADPDGAGESPDLLGLDVDREYSVGVNEGDRQEARDRFDENLRDIVGLAAGRDVPVVLVTVPSNLRGWVPNESVLDPSLSTAQQGELRGLIGEGRAALSRGEATPAVARFESAIALDPGYAEAHYLLGQACEAEGRQIDALEAYRTARDLDGKPARALTRFNDAIRVVAGSSGQPLVDAVREFEDAARGGLPGFDLFEDYVHPKPRGHQLIALALWRTLLRDGLAGPPREADDAAFWAALGLDGPTEDGGDAPLAASGPHTPAMLYNLGVVLENQGRFDEAADRYRRCVELDPGYFVARVNLGRLLYRAGRHAEAAEQYRQALLVEPEHLASRIGLGEALRAAGQLDESLAALQSATRLDPESAHAWDSLGGTWGAMQRNAEAEQAFRNAVRLDPDNPNARANLGWALLLQARLDEAQATFRETLEQQPAHVRARHGLAAALIDGGGAADLDDAERLLRAALAEDPGDDFARRGLARIDSLRSRP